MIIKAVAYCRVSTDDQSLGLDAQREMIAAYALSHDMEVVAWETDRGVSGGSEMDAREGLVRALGEIKAREASSLLVARRDRLARDIYVACTIERACAKLGAQVMCADGTANGDDPQSQFMRRILDAAAEYERALIRLRVKAALDVKRARGERTGSVPYGSRVRTVRGVAMLEPNAKEQEIMARAKELRARGLSLRQIAGVLPCARSGQRFHPYQVARMLDGSGT